jgi:hypothetical protein
VAVFPSSNILCVVFLLAAPLLKNRHLVNQPYKWNKSVGYKAIVKDFIRRFVTATLLGRNICFTKLTEFKY